MITDLLPKIAQTSTIEESFFIFFDELIKELDNIHLTNDDHDLKNLIRDLKNNRITFAKAIASNIIL